MDPELGRSSQAPLLPPLAQDLGDFVDSIPLLHISRGTDAPYTPEESGSILGATNLTSERESAEMETIPLQPQKDPDHGISRRSSIAISTTSSDDQRQPPSFFTRVFKGLSDTTRSVDNKIALWIRQSRFHGWRMGVLFGCCTSTFVLCCNIAMIVVGSTVHSGYNSDGVADLIVGDEATISRWNTSLHVLINVLSTMLLAGSNYTMQVLSAPTRKDVDVAHAKGQWLDIGLLSTRNLRAIPRHRVVLWVALALSSIPLHLFYNASVFKVVTSVDFNAFTLAAGSDKWEQIRSITDNDTFSGTYSRLTNDQWSNVYNREHVSGHGDLYLTIDLLAFDTSQILTDMTLQDVDTLRRFGIEQEMTWAISHEQYPLPGWIYFKPVHSMYEPGYNEPLQCYAHVAYAFSQKKDDLSSRVRVSLYFMVTVIVFNILKLSIMASVLITDRSAYLVTIGDAAASFLKRIDPSTTGKCMLGREEMLLSMGHPSSHPISSTEEKEDLTLRMGGMWLPRPRYYFFAVTRNGKVFYTIMVLCIIMVPGFYPLYATPASSWSWGASSQYYLPFSDGNMTAAATLKNAWFANAPQLLLSFSYLAINTICTSMAGTLEWNNLANFRKGLRVTQSHGSQRSTYFLQLPYRWSLPLIITSGTLHWLLSQTFFLVRVDFFDSQGKMLEHKSKSACGFSTLSLFVLLSAFLILLCTVGWIGFRNMSMKAPIIASCSLAISAACHPPPNEIDPHLAKVRWGVVQHEVVEGFGHCSLSSKSVKKPEVGKTYH
ncbi:uncharacterized protein K460DRAFT_330888 [Cucurbitaria berberidis CBS 394.84]|uniref:DUF6536 domain-containing protein n=1 Tax=Cucurbitaria berberidis CBS 394.84 TaxID=1168544 RepID=A0A9P4GPY3_9PLEO|nr:uncharacterized protein K460DRAFT_330888 [Cucurbitaria berberidis CBS 394.84]KAF1849177.1 hypothetical protein K460DRAFT_330888 [Cucurbitaria berberidis CBS 394.84]